MKFHVQLDVSEDVGNRLETTPGALDFIGRFLDRFKPEAAYFGANRRRAFLVVDFESMGDLAEFAMSWTRVCGKYPEFTAVGSVQEFGQMQAEVMPKVAALVGDG